MVAMNNDLRKIDARVGGLRVDENRDGLPVGDLGDPGDNRAGITLQSLNKSVLSLSYEKDFSGCFLFAIV